MHAVAVIPARYASTRFPGKPLAMLRGKPIIEHVYKRTCLCPDLEKVIVATDDQRIFDVVEGFGGNAVMTSPDHTSGSDRMGELARGLDAEFLVNVQGDEPMIEPSLIEAVLIPMGKENPPDIFTAAVPLKSREDYENPDIVKVVLNGQSRALYFSRSPIPYGFDAGRPGFKHLGIYAYRKESLLRFVGLPQGTLEKMENLEQLRALENGMSIGVAVVDDFQGIGIDRPEDLLKAEEMLENLETRGN